MDMATAELWMREALNEARQAERLGEVSVGAVVLVNEKIVGRGHNQTIGLHDPSAHAEVLGLRHAARFMKNHRLPGATLVVTVEPCVMCAGAIIQARIELVIYGAADLKAGCLDSHLHLANAAHLNHHFNIMSGILEQKYSELIQNFFVTHRRE